MEKQFVIRLDEKELDRIKDYAKENSISAAELFRNAALNLISTTPVLADMEEMESLRASVQRLTEENNAQRDTLESLSKEDNSISHKTITGREIPNYGLPTKALNQCLANVHYRLARIPAGSADHYCRVTNSWASAVLRITTSNFVPSAPSKEELSAMEKAASKS
jgi:hypothetical protein